MSGDDSFPAAFLALTGNAPFPWQERLYDRLSRGTLPDSCDIPTGLGKTAIIPIWLIALAGRHHAVPRRLVYVVNRRTVVDQATAEAEKIRERLLRPGGDDASPETQTARRRVREALEGSGADPGSGPLAISTLRGQFADNREWSADPSRPAVIVGTVDMIGSRLLFSGYRAGFKTKPLHAGFLGQDALLVHDEAHLEPAFQKLIESIRDEQEAEHKKFSTPLGDGMRLKVLALTATPRGGVPLRLTQEDRDHPEVKKRIEARKSITLHPYDDKSTLPELLARHALSYRDSGRAVLVFAATVEAVEKVASRLRKECPGRVEMLTGTLRGKERDELVTTSVFKRFLPGAEAGGDTAYLVCTSAGEVGINVSADHLACDLSTFESMAQRFGRVNRFGGRDDTRVDIFHPREFESGNEVESRREKTLALLRSLDGDGSPAALGKLDPGGRLAAFSPEPLFLETTDILFDAWALTSVRDKLPGRPPVEPYLHGLSEWEPPVTQVAWRKEVGIIVDALRGRYEPEDLLADYPLKPHELLRDRSDRVFKHLRTLAEKHPEAPAWLVDDDGTVQSGLTLKALADKDRKDRINHKTVLLPPSVGGLDGGLLDGTSAHADDVADEWYVDKDRKRRKRSRAWDGDRRPEGMRLVRGKIDTRLDAGDEVEVESAETDATSEDETERDPGEGWREGGDYGKRYWRWYAAPSSADDDPSRTSPEPVSWDHHTRDVTENAKRVVKSLSIPEELKAAVVLAAEFHDLGKKRVVWQRSIGNPTPTNWLAKSGGKMEPIELTRYRHELGSLLDAERELRDRGLEGEIRDLVLHLIAAHHGRGRPHFPEDESFDPERSAEDAARVAAEVPRRFARLQRRYGRWGLAYLESLLRAADYAASAPPDYHDGGRLMINLEPTIRVNVDPTNPGQFFACCGLLELADRLWPGAEGWFDRGEFRIAAGGGLPELIHRLLQVDLTQIDAEDDTGSPIAIGPPLPLRLDWWRDDRAGGKDLKVWAGTMESVRIARAMRHALRHERFLGPNLFDVGVIAYDPDDPRKKVEPFYFDARRGPNAHSRDVGFSPNDLQMTTTAFPAVELLCLVGLQRCLPARTDQPRVFRYFTWALPLVPALTPAAVSGLLPHVVLAGYQFENWYRTGQRKHKAFRSAIPFFQRGDR